MDTPQALRNLHNRFQDPLRWTPPRNGKPSAVDKLGRIVDSLSAVAWSLQEALILDCAYDLNLTNRVKALLDVAAQHMGYQNAFYAELIEGYEAVVSIIEIAERMYLTAVAQPV